MASVETKKVVSNLVYNTPPDDGVRAFLNINEDPTTGVRSSNVTRVNKQMEVEDLRGNEDSVGLDTAGFQFYRIPSNHKSFVNDEEIKKEYYSESVELIKKLTGATRVELFDHTIRRRRPGQIDDGPNNRQPVSNVHVDQTSRSAITKVHRHLGPSSEVPELLKHRFQIINLWRPIGHIAYDWPLALCDYRSVDPEKDTFPIALIFPDREGETLGVIYNEKHKWKYLRNMTPDELVLIKCFDSVQNSSVAVFTPHTGFEDPSTPSDAPLRESIELRALVFYS